MKKLLLLTAALAFSTQAFAQTKVELCNKISSSAENVLTLRYEGASKRLIATEFVNAKPALTEQQLGIMIDITNAAYNLNLFIYDEHKELQIAGFGATVFEDCLNDKYDIKVK